MKFFLAFCLLGIACAFPSRPYGVGPPPKDFKGNPDEWGTHYQGDIVLVEGEEIPKNGISDVSKRWTDGKVPYTIANNLVDDTVKMAEITRSMNEYYTQTNGCIEFIERTTETDYVRFTSSDIDSGCHSYVGRIGGAQQINYPFWCISAHGSVMHEMLHALGFYHMQSTYDRDDYVTINEANIIDGYENNFAKEPEADIDDYGVAYDFGSVMHYGPYAFAKDTEVPTITTNDPQYQTVIGQRVDLSESDLVKLKSMYNCDAKK